MVAHDRAADLFILHWKLLADSCGISLRPASGREDLTRPIQADGCWTEAVLKRSSLHGNDRGSSHTRLETARIIPQQVVFTRQLIILHLVTMVMHSIALTRTPWKLNGRGTGT